jgi:hypothetical protein
MNHRRLLLPLTIVAVIVLTIPGVASPTTVDDVEPLASGVMANLTAGNPRGAIARIHEPRAWDGPRAADDRQKASEHFATLLKEFGKISAPRLAGAVAFYELQVAGADVPYWQSLPNFGIDSTVTYLVKFSRVGPGIVALRFTRASASLELRSISLGLDRSRPESKEAMMRIGRIFLRGRMPNQEIESALARILGQEPI